MIDNPLVPANEIWYTSINGEPIELSDATQKNTVSNTYRDGKGVIVFKEPFVEIGVMSFKNCTGLQKVVIPSNVIEIGWYAFEGCTGLQEIVILEGVAKIGTCAFMGCISLHKVVIPSSVTEIDCGAFSGCNSLQEVVIPNGVKKIDEIAFRGCTSLHEVVIPSSVTEIGSGVFEGCSNLAKITVEEDNVIYDSREGCNAIILKETNCLIISCRNTVIPSSVTRIIWAFSGRTDLQEIVIPEGVTIIGEEAFRDCTNLRKIVLPSSITEIGCDVFLGCTSLHKIVIPESVTSIGSSFSGCTGLQEVVISSSVTEIGDYAFSDCIDLREVVIPEGVTRIGFRAFDGCTGLRRIVIPSTITTIDEEAFRDCTSLCEVVISEGVRGIGFRAFGDCINLCEIVIPEGIKIDGGAFERCSSLEIVHLPAVMSIVSILSPFSGCDNLKAIYVPLDKVDYYKEHFPSSMHWLIVEEGSDLPTKAENFIAKDITFAPTLRVIVPKGESDSYILSVAKEKLEKLGSRELVKWLIDHLESITDSQKPYNEKDC